MATVGRIIPFLLVGLETMSWQQCGQHRRPRSCPQQMCFRTLSAVCSLRACGHSASRAGRPRRLGPGISVQPHTPWASVHPLQLSQRQHSVLLNTADHHASPAQCSHYYGLFYFNRKSSLRVFWIQPVDRYLCLLSLIFNY